MIRQFLKWMNPYVKVFRVIILVLVSFIYSMFQGGFVSWFIFYVFLPFALYALLLAVYPLEKVKVSRRVTRTNLRVGDSMEVHVGIQLPWFIPLVYMVVEDELSSKLQVQCKSNKVILFPFFRKNLQFSYSVPSIVRGEHKLENVNLTIGDYLGLYEKSMKVPFENRVIVYPSYEQLSYGQLQSVYEEGNNTAASMQNRREVAAISGIRSYIPGDKISWIHWNATARKNELMTKNFEESTSQDVVVILDKTTIELFEERITFVASLTYTLLQKGVAVAYTNTDQLQEPFVFGRGTHHKDKIMHALAKEDIEQNNKNHIKEAEISFHHAACIVITSNVSQELVTVIDQLKSKDAATVIVMQKQEDVSNTTNSIVTNKGIVYRSVTPTSYLGGAL